MLSTTGRQPAGPVYGAQAFDVQKVTVDNVRSVLVHEPSISFQSELLVSLYGVKFPTVSFGRAHRVRKREAGMDAIDVKFMTPKELSLEVKTLFVFVTEEEGLAKAHGDALLQGVKGSPFQFYIDARGLLGEPHCPDNICKCQVVEVNVGIFRVSFTPQEFSTCGPCGTAGSQEYPRVSVPSARFQSDQSPCHRPMRIAGGQSEQTGASGRRREEDQFRHSGRRAGRLVGGGQRLFRLCGVYERGVRKWLSFTPPQVGEYVAKLLWNRVLFLIAPHVVGITRSNDLPSKSRASSISSTGSVTKTPRWC